MNAHKVFRMMEAVYLTVAVFTCIVLTVQVHPIITGDVLLDDSHLLSRSQMTAWIIWMNTVISFALGYIVFSVVEKWLRKRPEQ